MRSTLLALAALYCAVCGCATVEPVGAKEEKAAQTLKRFTQAQLRLKGKKGIGMTLRDPGSKSAATKGGTGKKAGQSSDLLL